MSAAQQIDTLPGAIMNLPCQPGPGSDISCMMSYKIGHRDARHAAAELASCASAAASLGAATGAQQIDAERERQDAFTEFAETVMPWILDDDKTDAERLVSTTARSAFDHGWDARAALAAPAEPALDTPAPAQPEAPNEDTARLDWLASEANDLQTVVTAEDDFAWQVIGHYQAAPRARLLSLHHDIRMAIDEARAIKSADDIAEAPESVEEAFERGRQQGMEQERALWELSALAQEIEADLQAPAAKAEQNQCDGCLRGLPVVSGGMHRQDGEWPFACTALEHRRRESAEAMRLAVRDLECPPDPEIVDRAMAQPGAPEPLGWAALDKDGIVVDEGWRRRHFFSAMLDDEAHKFDAEDLARLDRECPGGAPHRCVPLHAQPEAPAVEPEPCPTPRMCEYGGCWQKCAQSEAMVKESLTVQSVAPAVREPLLTPEQIAALWHAATPSWPAGISLSDFKLVAEVIEPAFRAACGIQGKP